MTLTTPNAPQTGDYLYRNASNQWERRTVADVKSDLGLATAAADISSNATAISNNASAISNNASAISNNTSAISGIDTRLGTAETTISGLHAVATSGDYNDLTNKPTDNATTGFAIAMSIVF